MKNKLFNVFFLSLPFIDLITALFVRNLAFALTPGIIIKCLFLLILTLYIFKSKSSYHKISMGLIITCGIYIISYLIFKLPLDKNMLLNELTFLFKLIFFPISFCGLLCYCDDAGITNTKICKILKYTLIVYTFLLLIPQLLGNDYSTYPEVLKGSIGWFYSGNEIANIMIMLFPFSFLFYETKYKQYLIIFPIINLIMLIGTKVSTFGVLIITFISFIIVVFKNKKFNKSFFIFLIIFIYAILATVNSYSVKNYNYMKEYNFNTDEKIQIDENRLKDVDEISSKLDILYTNNKVGKIVKTLIGGRNILFANTLSIYTDSKDDSNVFFGIGFSNNYRINNSNVSRLIEIDILDGFFHFGIIGLLIMLSPLFLVVYFLLKNKVRITLNSVYLALIIALILGVSCLSGHVFLAPAVSIYFGLILILFLNEFKLIGRREDLSNKIAILSLHLGYGGIEKSIVDQANMLSERYPVEIISLYNTIKEVPYKVNKKVKIIYLSDLKPNKKEFWEKLQAHKYFATFKEGLKSIYILYQKRNLVANYIYNSDAKIIISTRIDFTKILNIYANPKTITIAEEHTYHKENKKYIKCVEKNSKNINYLIPASRYLENDYQKFLANSLTMVKYIPQTITALPSCLSKCQNKNIIAVARLSKEKGLDDLIKSFNIVIQKDRDIKLTIVGDGEEKANLEKLVHDLNIKDNITFTGYLSQEELKKEYAKSSLFVMTSHEESFGLVLLEAMSYNIPCFAFDSAKGAVEQINSKNGKLIPNRDISVLASEILNYFEKGNKEYEPAKTIEKYLPSNVKKIWYSFIEEILGKSEEKKIVFISSMGGHFNELLQLQPTMQKYNSYLITEKSRVVSQYKMFYLMAVSRYEKKYIIGIVYNTIKSLSLFLKINPDFIISTGSHTAVAICYIAKLFGKKVIYIESFANINQKSLAGKLVYPISDVFIVQWKEMQKLYPKAKYWGCLY